MEKREGILLALCTFFAGIVLGFLFAPIKKGLYCGNNNGNTYGLPEDQDWDWHDEADEDDNVIRF